MGEEAADSKPASTNDQDGVAAEGTKTPLEMEMEKAKDMKVGELKMKLMAMGILTNSFCEKSEFVRAYAEAILERTAVTVEDGDDEDDDDNNEGSGDGLTQLKCFQANVSSDDEKVDDEDDEDPMADLPIYVQRRLLKLKELHDEREALMAKYLKERAQLEAKYQSLCKPLYNKRRDIVRGDHDDEIDKMFAASDGGEGGDSSKKKKGDGKNDEEDEFDKIEKAGEGGAKRREEPAAGKVAGIPQFWVCALNHMDVVGGLITENDVACLEYLQDITCDDDENGEGFTLKFHFSPNIYFEDTVLTKKYEVPNLLLADEPILKSVEGCEIHWKKGKCLTETKVTKKQRGTGKNAGQVRTVAQMVRCDSFFHFFQPPIMPALDQMNDEVAAKLEQDFDEDYDIAQAFRSHIVPKAALWFTGQVRTYIRRELMECVGKEMWLSLRLTSGMYKLQDVANDLDVATN